MITVVNRHKLPDSINKSLYTSPDNVYRRGDSLYTYIGRGTPLGNHTGAGLKRPDALKAYQQVLESPHSPELAQALAQVRTWSDAGLHVHLVCSCAPSPCHGDLIAHYLENSLPPSDSPTMENSLP